MVFNSLTFLVFFVSVWGTFWILRGWAERKSLLLISSYVFYAAWSPPYALLLLGSTTIDWWLARCIGQTNDPRRRRWLLIVSLASNLLILGYFKYGNFLIQNFQFWLQNFGIAYNPPAVDIILPIGISFYTFASLSYLIDVYRGQIRSDWSWKDYALFVSFFPHLVAGPIVRASCLMPQIEHPRLPDPAQTAWGLSLVIFGLFFKIVLADSLLAPVVDQVYASPASFGAFDTWAALLGFSGQIYFDFCGYSLCAIGIALCFGYHFPDNFRRPFAALSMTDFWRRWHISLSSWLRDYLYISLGGNRKGTLRTARNLLITMLLGGLWHGASWMFVCWGAIHGIMLGFERILRAQMVPIPPAFRQGLLPCLLTFMLVTLAWIPFRASNAEQALAIVKASGNLSLGHNAELSFMLAWVVTIITVCWHIRLRDIPIETWFMRLGAGMQASLVLACLSSIFLFSGSDQRAFIYFQF